MDVGLPCEALPQNSPESPPEIHASLHLKRTLMGREEDNFPAAKKEDPLLPKARLPERSGQLNNGDCCQSAAIVC